MNDINRKKADKVIALALALSTVFFLILAFTNDSFFNWAYDRHQNQLSWYIRPLFILPFSLFAYRKSWSGISGTVLLLLTSMFWFPKPSAVNSNVQEFLNMEKAWLTGSWDLMKIALTLLVPLSFIALGFAFWKRNLWFGLTVVAFIAVAKMIWSVVFGGEAGRSIFAPAIIGLCICIALIILGFRRLEKKKQPQ